MIKRKGNAAQRFLIKANLKEAGIVAKTFDFSEALLVKFPEGLVKTNFLTLSFLTLALSLGGTSYDLSNLANDFQS